MIDDRGQRRGTGRGDLGRKPLELGRQVTYSPAYTLVPTYGCFNRCSYCNFRQDLGEATLLSLGEAERVLRSLSRDPQDERGVWEVLILSGEVHPHSDDRPLWFQRLYDLARLALDLGFLPHTNAGPLSFAEMARLKEVNVSLGLMVEQVNPGLLQTVHRHAPSKDPGLRLQQLEWAGELRIPFTTGLLVGLGESWADRRETLGAIAEVHQRWHHIQEVILQPYQPGSQEAWRGEGFPQGDMVALVTLARQVLPPDITIQIPPNLVDRGVLLACIGAGARDLGGIGPRDEVNPDYDHPTVASLRQDLEPQGWQLVPRLPVYPRYWRSPWLSPRGLAAVGSQGRQSLALDL